MKVSSTVCCVNLTLAGSTTVCHSLHFVIWEASTKLVPLALLRFPIPTVWSSYGHVPVWAGHDWRDTSQKNCLTNAKLKKSTVYLQKHFGRVLRAQADSDSHSAGQNCSANAREGLPVVGAVSKDKCSHCLGCNPTVFIQAKSHEVWFIWECRLRPMHLFNQ